MQVETVPAKTIVTRSKSGASWFGIDYNMNIYRGCSHGCIYCDSRSECYGIADFDRVRVKANALEIIRNDLSRKRRSGVVATGAMSDPYNPLEQELFLTRHALELLDAYGFGAAIATKSDLITRDIDVLHGIQEHSPVLCKMTVTACGDDLCAKLEPNAPPSSRRFQALQALSEAGIFCGILLMPVLPFLEDTEENVLGIVQKAGESGAKFIYPAFGVTLRQNQRDYFFQQLDKRFPGQGLKERYLRRFGNSYQCTSPNARVLWNLFSAACRKHGILYRMQDIIQGYRQGREARQMSLFDLGGQNGR